MRKLRQYIFDYLRKRMPERNPRFPHFDEPLKLMIIYESDALERNDAIKEIRQDLLKRRMDVTMWGFVAKKEILTLVLPQSRILGLESYNLFGKPKEDVLTDLRAVHYDLVIDLTTQPLLPLRYLTMYTDADFKVGLNLGEGLHDMLISMSPAPAEEANEGQTAQVDTKQLYNEIMKYLTTIKSLD